MCRMLALVGQAKAADILALRPLAAAGHVPQDVPGHGDGWGVVVGPGPRYVGRSAASAATDPAFEAAAGAAEGARLAIVHLRKASHGTVAVENSHPFVADGLAFCHNGTVKGIAPAGQSDSRAYFARILEACRSGLAPPEALVQVAKGLDPARYSSITCLLSDGRSVWGLRKVGLDTEGCGGRECALDFYTLGVARVDGTTIVAQEHGLQGTPGWTSVPDGGLLTVGPDGSFSIRRAID